MTYYIGNEFNSNDILGEGNPRFFYALRRQDEGATTGNLYFTKIDQILNLKWFHSLHNVK
jgi:hypothetical protein